MLRIAKCAARIVASLFLIGALLLAPLASAQAASFNKFNLFPDDLVQAELNFSSDTIKAMLTNTLPVATNHEYSDISASELANGDGYTTGGATVSGFACSNSSGTETCTASATTWTSSTSSMGPFEYVVYYDYTSTNKTLLGWYSVGSAITLNGANSDTFTITPTGGNLFTLAKNDRLAPFSLYAANDNWPVLVRVAAHWRHAA